MIMIKKCAKCVQANIRIRAYVLGLTAIVAGFAFADVYDETTGFVTLLRSDGSGVTSLSSAGNWSDGLVPHDNPPTNYYVAAGLSLMGPSGSVTFPSPLFVAGDVRCGGAWGGTGIFSDLRILAGGVIKYYEIGKLAGRITFLSEDAANPSFIRYARSDSGYAVRLVAKIIGSERSQIRFEGTARGKSWITDESGADWSEFKGTLSLADGFGTKVTSAGLETPGAFAHGNNALLVVNANKSCSFGSLSFAGSSIVTNYAKVNVSGVLDTGAGMKWNSMSGGGGVSTVGTFTIGNGSSFYFHKASSQTATGAFNVTNRLSVGENVEMSFTLAAESGNTPAEYTVFKLSPEAVAVGLPDFSSISASMNTFAGAQPEAFIAVKDDPDVLGGKIAYLSHKQIVTYTGPDQLVETNLKMDRDVDQTGVWSDDAFPSPGRDYYLPPTKSIAFRVPTAEHPNRVTSFPGDRLIMNDNSIVYLYTTVHVPSLHVYSTSLLYPRNSCALTGKLTIHRHPTNASKVPCARMLGSIDFGLNSEIGGDGDLNAESFYPISDVGSTLYLGGVNTNWTGGIKTLWTKQNASDPDASETAHTRIVVGDGRSLGGALPAFRHDSLKLHNYAELRVTNTTTFAEVTRGVLVLDNGCLNVDAGKTAMFTAPLTLDGTLRKTGNGTLSLGGPLRFGQNDALDDTTAPMSERNVIMVKAGALKVTNAKALDGSALDFAAGTSLRLDLHPSDVGMQSTGFVFMDSQSAISYDGRLPVVFEGGTDDEFKRGITVPLCTVLAGSAETMMSKVKPCIELSDRLRSGTLSSVDNGNGTQTIYAHFAAKGLIICFW